MKNKIITIRDKEVVLDRDLAEICQVETKNLNKSIKRHIEKFNDFNRFKLTNDEFNSLRFQNGTLKNRGEHTKYLPFAFTKEGVEVVSEIMKKEIDISRLFSEMQTNQLLIQNENLRSKIYDIRGLQVMLDFDLAQLYQVETKVLKQSIKRNSERFPGDFMFKINESEIEQVVSQFVTPSKSYLGGASPYAFTEQGVSMLAGLLNSKFAIQMNIKIIRTFINMRKFIANNATVFQRLGNLEQKQVSTDLKLDKVLNIIEENEIKPKQGIFYKGQMFDAYELLSKIIRSANKSIIVIDNYIDESTLLLFNKRNKKVKTVFYTKNLTDELKQDLEKYNSQYKSVEILQFKSSHDRFLIIDEKLVFHFGASLKDVGKAWFAFSKLDIDAKDIIEKLK